MSLATKYRTIVRLGILWNHSPMHVVIYGVRLGILWNHSPMHVVFYGVSIAPPAYPALAGPLFMSDN